MSVKNGSYFSSLSNFKKKKKVITIDAKDKPIGRISSLVARKLLGKDDYLFNSSSYSCIKVIIKNSSQSILTGNKEKDLVYRNHSGRPGGEKILSYKEVKQQNPKRIFERSIKGMLPKNRYGRKLFSNLQISFE